MVTARDLAETYRLEDLTGASVTGGRLNGILLRLAAGQPLTPLAMKFLKDNGFAALSALAEGRIDATAFAEAASTEQSQRQARAARHAVQAARVAEERAVARRASEERAAEERAAERAAYAARVEADPHLKRRREARALRDRFEIGFVDEDHYPRVMRLLRQLDAGTRLAPEDMVWLSTEAEDCWTEAVQRAWHRIEAQALTAAWTTGGDPWNAVNASAHWRKAEAPDEALALIEAALAAPRGPKLRSALLTTRGGALRDTGRLDAAAQLGTEAHALRPRDFRPCTLLGAVAMEQGDVAAGRAWYAEAEARGASTRVIDADLRAVLRRATPELREKIRAYLLAHEPERYGWLRRR